ncbi:MAG: SurA N-terminal domain-containing protein [Candidatus Saccharimonadales bacterium]
MIKKISTKIHSNKISLLRTRISKRKSKSTIVAFIFISLIICGGIFAYIKTNTADIKIGDNKITKSDIDTYEKLLNDFIAANPDSSFSEDNRQFAIDSLIMNAALKLEAQNNGISITDDDIALAADRKFETEDERKAYFSDLRAPNNKINLVYAENRALQAKLTDKLVRKMNLLEVNIVLDSPYFRNLPQDQVQAEYDKAKTRLEKEVLPLVAAGASKEDIAKIADTIWYEELFGEKSTDAEIARDLGLYIGQATLAVNVQKDYQKGVTRYNDIDETRWIRGNIGEPFTTTDKINELKNVGDNTGIFVSKTGAFMIVRVDSINNGTYDSWDAFLTKYKNDYTNNRLKIDKQSVSKNASKFADTVIRYATSPGLKKAQAAVSDQTCLDHSYTVTLQAINSDNGASISGAKVKAYRDPNKSYTRDDPPHVGDVYTPATTCGAAGSFYMLSDSGGNITAGSWSRSGENNTDRTFHDSCWNTPVEFSIADEPAGYKRIGVFYQKHKYDASENDIYLNPGYPNIKPGLANNQDYWIIIKYQKNYTPPPPTVTGNANININCDAIWGNVTPGRYWSVFIDSISDANRIGQSGGTPSSGSYIFGINGGSYFGQYPPGKGTRTFFIKTYQNYDAKTGTYSNQTSESSYTQSLDCINSPPSFSINSLTCSQVTFTISDNDDQGQGLYYELILYQDKDPGKATTYSGRGSGTITLGDFPAESAPNNGWRAGLRVKDIGESGRWPPYSDGSFTYGVNRDVGPCYNGACSLNSFTASPAGTIPGSSPSEGVVATKQFNVNYTLTNTGPGDRNPLYSNVSGAPLTLTTAGATAGTFPSTPPYFAVGQTVGLGSSVNGTMTFNAPATAGRHTVTVYPDYYGLFSIGAPCTIAIDVYQPFKIKPLVTRVEPKPNNEDPLSIEYDTKTESKLGAYPPDPTIQYFNIPILVKGKNQLNYFKHEPPPSDAVTLKGPPLDSDVINNTGKDAAGGLNGSNTWQRIWNRINNPAKPNEFRPGDTWSMGDQFCGRIDIDYNEGWTNGLPYPGGQRVLSPVKNTSEPTTYPLYDVRCGQIIDTPFMRAYGGDVISNGPIRGFMANPDQGAGSGVEFAAISGTSPIDFASAFFRNAFSGANPAVASKPQSADGLKLTGTLRAGGQPKYFDETIKRETKAGGGGLSYSSPKNNNQSYGGGGTLAGNPAFTGRHAIYAEGDVVISGDIKYGPAGGGTINDIPAFALVVKGDIYISDTVAQLDGLYISQGGTIHTCTDSGRPLDLGNPGDKAILLAKCSQKQLKVDGLLVAEHLKFYRIKGTLRDITYAGSGSNRFYTPRETFDTSGGSTNETKAGEALRLTPEVLLGQYGDQSIFRALGSQTGNKYEYIVTLPPIL